MAAGTEQVRLDQLDERRRVRSLLLFAKNAEAEASDIFAWDVVNALASKC